VLNQATALVDYNLLEGNHPLLAALMDVTVGAGLHGAPWTQSTVIANTGTHTSADVKRAAGVMLFTELEPSILCPISMTYVVSPALMS
jgi:putative acyl-CoA dehydrogenase